MKSPILCLLWFMSMLTARAESPSEAEVRDFLRPALHPALSAEEHKKLLEAAAGNAGDALLASAYGTNTLSAALLAGDPDVRVLHAMDFKPGTFAATNLLQGLRHPCEEADIQLVDCFYSELTNVVSGLVSLERTNTYRAICLFVATRAGGQGPWTLEFLGLANRSSPELVYVHPVYAWDDSWACFSRPGNWAERRERLAKIGLSERAIRPGMSAAAYMQSSQLKSIILTNVPLRMVPFHNPNDPTATESWASKFAFLEQEVKRLHGKQVSFFLAPDLATELVPGVEVKPGRRVIGHSLKKVSLFDALNLLCETQSFQYELTDHGVHLSFAPGRVRQPDPEPEIEPKPTTDDFGFGIEPSP
jgi:hypothetical protein